MQASQVTPVSVAAVDLKQALRAHFTANNHDVRHLEVLEHWYCQYYKTLELIEGWYKTEYPKVKNNATPQDVSWIATLVQQCAAIREQGNNAQDNILKILTQFVKKYPTPDKDYLMEKFKNGHCDGIAYQMGMAHVLQNQPRGVDKDGKALPRDDVTWMHSVYDILLAWDGTSELTKEQQREVLTFIRSITATQHSYSRLSIAQGDWHKIYSDTRQREFKEPEKYLLRFNREGIKKLTEVVLPYVYNFHLPQNATVAVPDEKKPSELRDVMLFPIGANAHRTLVIKLTDPSSAEEEFVFFDSNNMCRDMPTVKDPKALATIMEVAHFMDPAKTDFNSFSARMLSLDETAWKLSPSSLFSAAEIKAMYPGQKTTMLMAAISVGNQELAQFWLREGASTTLSAPSGSTALIEAAVWNRPAEAKILLDQKDTNVEAAKVKSGRRAAHIAAQRGHAEVLRKLVDKKADVNAKTKDDATKHQGWAPLHYAAYRGHRECAEVLLDAKANIEAETKAGETPIWLAVQARQLDLIDLLIERGANLLISVGGKSLLELAGTDALRKRLAPFVFAQVSKNWNAIYFAEAMQYMPGPNAPLADGSYPVITAAQQGNVRILGALHSMGVDMSFKDKNGNTPLSVAAASGDIATVNFLLNTVKVDLSLEGNRAAIFKAKHDVVKEALKKAFFRHAVEEYRGTQLQLAKSKNTLFRREPQMAKRVVIADAVLSALQENKLDVPLTKKQAALVKKEKELETMVRTLKVAGW
jgi:ankyrin repeat protein